MAAYAATVTTNFRKSIRIGENLSLIAGTVDITNYNTTLAAIANITKHFKSVLAVILSPVSDNGYSGAWVAASSSIKCFYGLKSHTHTLHFQTSAAANAVTAATNSLRTAAAAFDVAGVANSSGEGGVVSVAAAAGGEVASDVDVGAFQFIAIGFH